MKRFSNALVWLLILGSCDSPTVQPTRSPQSEDTVCRVFYLNQTTKGVKTTLNYQLPLEDNSDPKTCLSRLEYSAETACAGMVPDKKKKLVEINLVSLLKGQEKYRLVVAGECQETEESIFLNGHFVKRLKFQKTDDKTITKSME